MKRSLTVKNLYDKRTGETVEFQNTILERAIGKAEKKGIWLVYGYEKNGKTWFVLTLARDLAASGKVAYISAEEGTDESFKGACRRAGITLDTRITFDEYISIDEIIVITSYSIHYTKLYDCAPTTRKARCKGDKTNCTKRENLL